MHKQGGDTRFEARQCAHGECERVRTYSVGSDSVRTESMRTVSVNADIVRTDSVGSYGAETCNLRACHYAQGESGCRQFEDRQW